MHPRSLRPIVALSFATLALGAAPTADTNDKNNQVSARSAHTRQGVSSCYRFSIRAKGATGPVTWKIIPKTGFNVTFSPSMGTVDPDFFGWADINVPFSPDVGACPGDMATFTVQLCVNGEVVACKDGCVTITGHKAGSQYVAVEYGDENAFMPNRGRSQTMSLTIPNEEPDFLPHAYDFLVFAEDTLAPGLDLYDLTPVSGFDLPTVIGAGTPLMSGKLEEILPGDELLVEIEIDPIDFQEDGNANEIRFVITDDDTPASTTSSTTYTVRCSDAPTESIPRNGTGTNAGCLAGITMPVLGTTWTAAVDVSGRPDALYTVVVGQAEGIAGTRMAAGELLVDLSSPTVFASVAPAWGPASVHSVAVPSNTALDGYAIATQAAIVGAPSSPVELCNALDLVLAPVSADFRCVFHEGRPRQSPEE